MAFSLLVAIVHGALLALVLLLVALHETLAVLGLLVLLDKVAAGAEHGLAPVAHAGAFEVVLLADIAGLHSNGDTANAEARGAIHGKALAKKQSVRKRE